MRRMNSVCFVQSCLTLWDTVFVLMVHLMLPEKKWKRVLWFLWSRGSQVEVKVFVCFLLIYISGFFVYLCVRCSLFLSISVFNTISFRFISSLQWTRTQREVPDQVVSRCPPAVTSLWDPGWMAASPKMTDRKIETRLGGRKRRNLKGIKREIKTRTRTKPRKACWRAWVRCSGRNEKELSSKS